MITSDLVKTHHLNTSLLVHLSSILAMIAGTTSTNILDMIWMGKK